MPEPQSDLDRVAKSLDRLNESVGKRLDSVERKVDKCYRGLYVHDETGPAFKSTLEANSTKINWLLGIAGTIQTTILGFFLARALGWLGG